MTIEKEKIAVFDFDGTITYCDSLMPFCWFLSGTAKWIGNMILSLPLFFGFLMGRYSRQEVKEGVLARFLKGMTIDEVRNQGKAFAESALLKLEKPDAMHRLKWHQSQKHRCILISASLDIYLQPWAKNAGFSDIITSSLDIGPDGEISGKLLGANCRGPEKTRRLSALIGPLQNYIIYAYGDSEGDKELLAASDFPYYKKMPLED